MSRPYRHLNRRVCNRWNGAAGTITAAEKRKDVKHGWNITITRDDGLKFDATDRAIGLLFNSRGDYYLRPDDWEPPYGPIDKRIRAIIDRLNGDIPYRIGHITRIAVVLDTISAWRPFGKWEISAHLYGCQKSWRSREMLTLDAARNDLISILQDELAKPAEKKGADKS